MNAQLAQQTGALGRTALRNPKPPRLIGNVELLAAMRSHCSNAILQQTAEALPNTIVVHLSKYQNSIGRQHAQRIIGPRTGTMKQQKTRPTGERECSGSAAKKCVVFPKPSPIKPPHNQGGPQKGSQHLHAFLRKQFESPPDFRLRIEASRHLIHGVTHARLVSNGIPNLCVAIDLAILNGPQCENSSIST